MRKLHPAIEIFLSRGTMPLLTARTHGELSSLLLDIEQIERNARAMTRSFITKAAAVSMIEKCATARRQITDAMENCSLEVLEKAVKPKTPAEARAAYDAALKKL